MDGPPFTVTDRLPFTLPDFTRHSWVADAARQTWEPRLDRIRRAWADIEWLSIRDGVRACALVGLSQSALEASIPHWSARGLSALGLSHERTRVSSGHHLCSDRGPRRREPRT